MDTRKNEMVSIVVPVYGVEAMLPRCLQSLLCQTYRNLQIILVDDGSPDNCPQICDQYAGKDSRITVIHQKNAGVSNARNSGLAKVQGAYVTFCDSDDAVEPEWIENLVSAMEKTEADVVAACHTRILPDGQRRPAQHRLGELRLDTQEQQIRYMIQWIMADQQGWEIWSRLFRADLIRKHDIRFCETCGNFAEDLAFVLEYTLYTRKMTSIAAAGYLYSVREDSMMSISRKNARLNAVNEVSFFVLKKMETKLDPVLYEKYSPILHFLILLSQYLVAISCSNYHGMGTYTDTIQRRQWWKEKNREIFACRPLLAELFGKISAGRILIFTRYLQHRCWLLFKIERFLFFKWNRYQDE